MVIARAVTILSIGIAAVGCSREPPTSHESAALLPAPSGAMSSASPSASSASIASPPPSASAVASGAASASAAPVSSPTASAKTPPSAAPCTIANGPVQLPFTGPVALTTSAEREGATALFNANGALRSIDVALSPGKKALANAAEKATSPACAPAGSIVYCVDTSGTIHRHASSGGEVGTMEGARPGAGIAAASLGGKRSIVSFLADRSSSEGKVVVAFASLDGGPPVQVSEDGSGATSLSLVPWGDRAVLLYVDARLAMTPIHARILAAKDKLAMEKDAVVFVGEGSTRAVPAALALGKDGPFGLFAGGRDVTSFGLSVVKISDPPIDDAPSAFEPYAAGINSAPVAATVGEERPRVAIVKPGDRGGAKREIEIGALDEKGAYKARCGAFEGSSFSDLAIAPGRGGSLFVAFTDGEGTWLAEVR